MPLAIMEIRRRYFPRGALALAALWLTLKFLGLDGPLRSPALRRRQPHARGEPRAGDTGGGDSGRPCPGGAVRESTCRAASRRTATGAGRPRVSRTVRGLSRCLRPPRNRLTVARIGTDLERLAGDGPEHPQGMARAEPAPRYEPATWTTARDDVLAHPALRFKPLRALLLNLITQARRVSALREDTHFAMTLPMPVLRRTLLELGRRLADVGILDTAEDVFHLRFDELERVDGVWPPPADLAEELRQAARRRAARRLELADTPLMDCCHRCSRPQPAGRSWSRACRAARESPRDRCASSAIRQPLAHSFPARCSSLRTRTRPGRHSSRRAAAVVVDTGAAMSHAAIVAREYGVPAVMGTGDGTRRLSDGQWVRVDGSRGQVFAASAPGEDAPARIAIDADGEHENGSGRDRLPERGDPVEIERVRDEPEQKDAENRPGHPAPAAAQ